jgi:hypothetical protein
MAISRNMGVFDVAFKADTALDDYQYYCVAAASTQGYVKLATGGCNPHPIGVLQDNGASARGENCSVRLFGPTIAKVAACDTADSPCPILVGHFLTVSSSGTLVCAASVGEVAHAMALEAITTACSVANIEVFWYGIPGASPGEAAC